MISLWPKCYARLLLAASDAQRAKWSGLLGLSSQIGLRTMGSPGRVGSRRSWGDRRLRGSLAIADCAVDVLQLSDKVAGKPSISLADIVQATTKPHQLAVLGGQPIAELVSLHDQAFNGRNRREGQAHVLVWIGLISKFLGHVAHK